GSRQVMEKNNRAAKKINQPACEVFHKMRPLRGPAAGYENHSETAWSREHGSISILSGPRPKTLT
ncbi:MAG TPA: hypothetical protein VGD54_05630, partial [Steroidobacteraceae bacterium]